MFLEKLFREKKRKIPLSELEEFIKRRYKYKKVEKEKEKILSDIRETLEEGKAIAEELKKDKKVSKIAKRFELLFNKVYPKNLALEEIPEYRFKSFTIIEESFWKNVKEMSMLSEDMEKYGMDEVFKRLEKLLNKLAELENKAPILFSQEFFKELKNARIFEKEMIALSEEALKHKKKVEELRKGGRKLRNEISEIENSKEYKMFLEEKNRLEKEMEEIYRNVETNILALRRFLKKILVEEDLNIEEKEVVEKALQEPRLLFKQDPKLESLKAVIKKFEDKSKECKKKEQIENLLKEDFFENFWKINNIKRKLAKLNFEKFEKKLKEKKELLRNLESEIAKEEKRMRIVEKRIEELASKIAEKISILENMLRNSELEIEIISDF